jgi:hypothetical protein
MERPKMAWKITTFCASTEVHQDLSSMTKRYALPASTIIRVGIRQMLDDLKAGHVDLVDEPSRTESRKPIPFAVADDLRAELDSAAEIHGVKVSVILRCAIIRILANIKAYGLVAFDRPTNIDRMNAA